MRTHKVLTIAKRDYIATVRTKAFLFGLVVAPVLFGGGSIAMSFLKSKPDLKDRHVAIIDHTGVVAGALVNAAQRKERAGAVRQEDPPADCAPLRVRGDRAG